jgi:hypothetical protein
VKFKDAMTKIGLEFGPLRRAHSMADAWTVQNAGFSDRDQTELHARRHQRRHCLTRKSSRNLQARPGSLADQRAADRGIAARLEEYE